MSSTILIVEDDNSLRQALEELLKDSAFIVQSVDCGASALAYVKQSQADLVILDWKLPDMDGETVFKSIQQHHPELPIIFLTAKDSPSEIAYGLSLGAADYLPKPFAGEELIARIRARLRQAITNELKVGPLVLNIDTAEVWRDDQKIELTPTEFQLLALLMRNEGKVLNRTLILNQIWAYSPDIESRVVDVYMGYLRKKIDKPFPLKLIYSVRGFGYQLKSE